MTDKLIQRFEHLRNSRGVWESHWKEVADRVWPDTKEDFQGAQPTNIGGKRTEKIFDATAAIALDRFSAALQSMLTPPAQRWHRLTTNDSTLNRDKQTQMWFDEVTRILFKRRYTPSANYSANQWKAYKSLGAFGTGVIFLDSWEGQNRYKTIHLGDIYIDENHQGVIDTVYRKLCMTGRQIVQRWGLETLPEKMQEQVKEKPDEQHELLHVVMPNDGIQHGRMDFAGMRYSSVYISIRDKMPIASGGYRTFPYICSRYERAPNEIYGRSPAMQVLPDIKMLNEMSKTMIEAAQKVVDPPLLLNDDGILGLSNKEVDIRAGGLNYGGVSPEGRALIQPLNTGANIAIGEDQMERRRRTINDAFLVNLFQILIETPEMTATEVIARTREKGALMSPAMDRQQSEALGPMIERELDLAFTAGDLPEMPRKLREAGGEFEIVYESPLARAQRSEELLGIQMTLETAGSIAQYDPTILQRFDYGRILTIAAEINGAPAEIMRSEAEVERMMQEQQEAEQEQLGMQELLQGAQASKAVAEAQAISGEQ